MKQYFRTILVGVLVFTSCTSSSKNPQTHFESIESTNPIDKTFTTIPANTEFGYPYQIRVVDSLILIADRIDNKALLIYDMKHNAEIGRFISVGRGPGEVLLPIAIEYQNDSLYILDRHALTGQVLTCNLADVFDSSIEKYKTNTFPQASLFAKTETGFLTSGPFSENLIREYDAKYDSITLNCNFYPEFVLQQIEKGMDRYLVSQGSIAYRKGNLLLTHAFFGNINFYRKGPQGYEETIHYTIGNSQNLKDRISQKNTKLQPNDIMYFNYDCACASKDAFYVLFDGQFIKREPRKNHSFLMKFDTDGNFIESYRLDAYVFSFTVTPDNMMYAVTITPEEEYTLSQVQL